MTEQVRLSATAGLVAVALGTVAVWPSVLLSVITATIVVGLVGLTVRRNRISLKLGVGSRLVPEAVLVPVVAGMTAWSLLIATLVMVALAVSCARFRPEIVVSRWTLGFALASCLLVWLRGSPALVAVFGVAVLVIAHRVCRSSRRKDVVPSLVDGAGLYLAANVVGWLTGLRSPSASARIGGLESTSSLFGERVIFPFTESLAVPPAVAAAYIAASVFLLLTSPERVPLRLACLGAASFVLIAADGRVAIVAAVGVAMVAVLWPGQLRAAPAVAVIALLLPLAYDQVRPVTDSILDRAASSVPSLIRQGEEARVTGLSGRERIWRPTVIRWQELSNSRKVAGYGANGHVKSGASNEYGGVLRGVSATPLTATPHSSALQQLLDGGLLGLGAWLALVMLSLRNARHDVLTAAILLTLVLTGLTEVTIAPGSGQVTLWLLLVGALATAPVRNTEGRRRNSVDAFTQGRRQPCT